MNPDLAVKLAQEIGSLVVQCHSLQIELEQAKQKIAELDTKLVSPQPA